MDDVNVMAAFESMSRAPDALVANFAGRLRQRRLFKTLDLKAFGQDVGRQQQRACQIDNAMRENVFEGIVHKDEGAKIGIYTQIRGDDERMHKKLHIWDGHRAQEISQFSPFIKTLDAKQFTRYFFENEDDRESARKIGRKR